MTGTAEPALAPPTSGPPPESASALAPPEPALASGPASALPPPENSGAILFAARPSLIRAMNEQLLLEHIRQRGPCSRAELARVSGLSKPTVSLALDNVERAGLVRIAGQRTGVPGRSARLYEIRPDAGLVLGLDIGHEYVRGAIADLSGEIRARQSVRAHATSVRGRVAERTRNGADQHIDAMAKKYLGKDKYPFRQPGEVRVIYRVEPQHITSTT